MKLPVPQEFIDIATVANANSGELSAKESEVVDSVLYRISKWGHRAAALSYRDRKILERIEARLRDKIVRYRQGNSRALTPEQTRRRCLDLLERTGLIVHQREREAAQ